MTNFRLKVIVFCTGLLLSMAVSIIIIKIAENFIYDRTSWDIDFYPASYNCELEEEKDENNS